MAFRVPRSVDVMKLHNYVEMDSFAHAKGFEQLLNEQEKLKYHDLCYNGKNNMVGILNKKENKFVQFYLAPSKKQNPFSITKLFAIIFNPKKLLPKNIYRAGEEAKKLDKELEKKIEKFLGKKSKKQSIKQSEYYIQG